MKKALRKTKLPYNSEKGISLIEIVFTVAILTFLLIASFRAIFSAQQLLGFSTQKSIAMEHAKAVLEEIQQRAMSTGRDAFKPVGDYQTEAGRLINDLLAFAGISEELPDEAVLVSFPSWDTQIDNLSSGNAHVKVNVAWNFRGQHIITVEDYILLAK